MYIILSIIVLLILIYLFSTDEERFVVDGQIVEYKKRDIDSCDYITKYIIEVQFKEINSLFWGLYKSKPKITKLSKTKEELIKLIQDREKEYLCYFNKEEVIERLQEHIREGSFLLENEEKYKEIKIL